jgi:hypothetical protein
MPRIYCVNCERETRHEVSDDGHLRCDRCGCINYPTSISQRKMEWYGDDEVETYCPRCESEEMHDYKDGKIKCQSCGLVRSL